MENATPSSPAPPYSTGAGGRFSKPHASRKRPTNPYDRPSLTTATNKSVDGGGWLSKLVVNPTRRLIVSGATRILPSFFSNSESPSAEAYEYDSSGDRDNEDVDDSVNAFGDARHTLEASPLDVPRSFGDAGPSNERDKLKGNSANAIIQQNKSTNDFDQIEHMIKGKQFSRDESCRLMEILKSRLVDDSVAEEEKKATNSISQGQDKVNDLDREIPSIWKQYDVETPMPHLQSNIQDEVAASPIDIAKAYMGSRAPETGLNTYGNISTDRREHEHNNPFTSKPHFLIPSSKSSTCWPGAMVQDQRAYLTPQTQRSRYGLHKFPQTPYSRTKPNLYQLQSDSRSPNISLTTLRQSCTPNFQQAKTSSDVVVDDDYESVGPIRRMRNKFVSKPRSEGPRSFSSAQIASFSNASTSFVPVFQITASASNFHSADKYEQTSKNYANSAGPSNERAKKILDRLDRHMPIPKEKAAELKLPTEWKRLPTQDKTSITPVLAPVTGSNLQKSGTLSENKSFLKGTDGVNFEDDKKTSNAATKIYTSVNDTGAGPSIGFKNTGVANETYAVINSKEKEKSQPWLIDNQINSQDLTRKRPSQPILKPISFKRPDPQQVISSDNGGGFTFSFSGNASSASEPLSPSIRPSFLPISAPLSKELPIIPAYSFGTKKYGEQVVFSFPSTSNAPVDDGASDLKFNFRSDRNRVSFGSIGKNAVAN
ncbi:hypothetical protein R6Q59_018081 [Mikania micrantha]